MIDILGPALVISIVLLGIHSYYGIRIIQRNIIFTDLAIGQMAAFGAAVSIFFYRGDYMYMTSLAFALLTALIISIVAKRARYLEAVIGLIYALGISGVFIILSKAPQGMEEFQNLMAYDILFTRMKDVITIGIVYLGIGVFLYVSYRRTKGFLHELIFFATFAATVTSSVKLAGVLVVFAILLAPAFIALQITSLKSVPELFKKNQLILAWVIGTIINIIAIMVSYWGDFPTGYTLVFCNALMAVLIGFLKRSDDSDDECATREYDDNR